MRSNNKGGDGVDSGPGSKAKYNKQKFGLVFNVIGRAVHSRR